jgi:hypothetical protein
MAKTAKDTDWALIEIDDSAGRITVLERWGYQWTTAPGVDSWTLAEQQAFHNGIVQELRATFNSVQVTLAGTALLCKGYGTLPIVFDIGWSLEQWKHWTVFVRKMPAGSTPTTYISHVDPPTRTIYLDSADFPGYETCNAAAPAQCRTFKAIPHEFVHTLTGTAGTNFDEYTAGSPFLADTDSILNIGATIRARHMTLILKELNSMVPDCTFSAS